MAEVDTGVWAIVISVLSIFYSIIQDIIKKRSNKPHLKIFLRRKNKKKKIKNYYDEWEENEEIHITNTRNLPCFI
jgi:hypothetical protein